MDALIAALAVALGCAAGLVAGLLPGFHVNTVCALAFAFLPSVGPAAAMGLAAMAAAHVFASVLPSTYLGAPGEDALLSAMPAHRLLLEGQGRVAVRSCLDGALGGLLASIALLLPYKWLLGEPGRLLDALDGAMAWVLGAVLLFLVLREVRRGAAAVAWAVAILALSAGLGLIAGRTPVLALLPIAASPLLPLLSGLFGAPALLETWRSRPVVPEQQEPSRVPRRIQRQARGGILAGVLAASATSVLPGMTSAVAAAVARAGRKDEGDPRPVLATLSAIAAAQVVLALAVLWLSLRARSGLAAAVQQAWPLQAWTLGQPPLALRWLLLAALASGALAYLAVGRMEVAVARLAARLPPAAVAGSALAVLVALVLLLSGAMGLLLFATSTAVGLVPLAAGRGRIHLTGCLLVPVLLYRLGWA